MNKIVCKIEFGLSKQRVVLYEGQKEKVFWMNLNYLPTFIAGHPEAKEVHLFGSQEYLQNIEMKTKEKEVASKYALEDFHEFIYNK